MSDPKPIVNLSVEEMRELLDRECPSMSAASRSACLQGTLLDLGGGRRFQIPDAPDDGKPTHYTTARIEKVGDTCTNN